jgi:uncharacterized protein involved in exopolysaccharide biosynthesis
MSITEDKLNDLRQRILSHEAKVASGDAQYDEAPYTIEELRDALAAISLNREAIVTDAAKAVKRTPAKTVDLNDLL